MPQMVRALDVYWPILRCDLCMYFPVCYGCAALYVGLPCYGRSALFVLLARTYLTGTGWTRGICSVCTFCRVLRLCCPVHERVVLSVPVCCATHCIVLGIRGCVCHLVQATWSVCTFADCYGCADQCMNVSYTHCIVHGDSRMCVQVGSVVEPLNPIFDSVVEPRRAYLNCPI